MHIWSHKFISIRCIASSLIFLPLLFSLFSTSLYVVIVLKSRSFGVFELTILSILYAPASGDNCFNKPVVLAEGTDKTREWHWRWRVGCWNIFFKNQNAMPEKRFRVETINCCAMSSLAALPPPCRIVSWWFYPHDFVAVANAALKGLENAVSNRVTVTFEAKYIVSCP